MMQPLVLLGLLAVLGVQFTSAYTDEALADKVTNLPGAEDLSLTFNQFSGYLTIPGTSGGNTKHMHYW
jgi:hypothetical protein